MQYVKIQSQFAIKKPLNYHNVGCYLCSTEAHKGHPLQSQIFEYSILQWKFPFYSGNISILQLKFHSILQTTVNLQAHPLSTCAIH